ncbi:DNA polymerase III subunit delta [Desulfothermus okinawensis JCM 13304]
MRPGYFFCICPDFEVTYEFIDSTLNRFPGKWEQKIIWGDENVTTPFFEYLMTSPLTNVNLAVILRHAEKLPQNFWDKLSNFLNRFNPQVCPFICIESQWNRGSPPNLKFLKNKKYYKFAQKKKWIFMHQGVSNDFILSYLKKWSTAHGITLSKDVIFALMEILPGNQNKNELGLSAIKNELQKLVALNKKQIELKDLSVISPSFEFNVFDLINSIEGISNRKKVWSIILKNSINSQGDIIPIIKLLLREAKMLWQLLKGEPVFLPYSVKGKKMSLANKLGEKKIIDMYNVVLNAELNLKTSNTNPKIVLENLVATLQNFF